MPTFEKILVKYPFYNLIILGEGEEEDKLKQMIKEKKIENKVFLLGYKKNVYNYLFNADCLIMTSLWEDPGFVLVESAYCNIPIISSDCKTWQEEFLNHGKGGMLFKPSTKVQSLCKPITPIQFNGRFCIISS